MHNKDNYACNLRQTGGLICKNHYKDVAGSESNLWSYKYKCLGIPPVENSVTFLSEENHDIFRLIFMHPRLGGKTKPRIV